MHIIRRLLVASFALLLVFGGVTNSQAQDDNDDTLIITAAWQPFENGVLFWNSFGEPFDEIWVMVDDGGNTDDGRGNLYVRRDDWNGEAVPTTSCAIDPVRGFGYLYSNLSSDIRNALGCPLGGEIGYDGSLAIDTVNLTFQIDGPGATIYSGNLNGTTIPATGTWQTDVFF